MSNILNNTIVRNNHTDNKEELKNTTNGDSMCINDKELIDNSMEAKNNELKTLNVKNKKREGNKTSNKQSELKNSIKCLEDDLEGRKNRTILRKDTLDESVNEETRRSLRIRVKAEHLMELVKRYEEIHSDESIEIIIDLSNTHSLS